MKILGEIFGIDIQERTDGEPGHKVVILIEDDEQWAELEWFSSKWVADLRLVLVQAEEYLKAEGDYYYGRE